MKVTYEELRKSDVIDWFMANGFSASKHGNITLYTRAIWNDIERKIQNLIVDDRNDEKLEFLVSRPESDEVTGKRYLFYTEDCKIITETSEETNICLSTEIRFKSYLDILGRDVVVRSIKKEEDHVR